MHHRIGSWSAPSLFRLVDICAVVPFWLGFVLPKNLLPDNAIRSLRMLKLLKGEVMDGG